MALTKTGRALLKVAADRLRELHERVEKLENERTKEALVEDVMELLKERDQVTPFSEEEKRSELKEKDIDELKQAKEMIEQFVSPGQYKIGQVEDGTESYSDPIMKMLFS